MKTTARTCDGPLRPIQETKERPPTIRVAKVREIKRQLSEGRYSLVERLDVILDRVLEALLG